MTINGFERIFTNNCEYEDYKGIPYMDSLAYTVQEFLYTDKARNQEQDYRMDGHIKLFDFMTVIDFFIKSLDTGLGRASIKGYIEDIKQSQYTFHDTEKVDYKQGALIITSASYELISALLWTTYIYANAIAQVPNSDLWKESAHMLYELMREYSFYKEEAFKEHLLIKQTREALCVMIAHIQKKANRNTKSQQNNEEESPKEAESNIDDIVIEEIDWHDKVRLDVLLQLMENDGANLEKHGNKMKAAKIMQSITGLPLQTCKNYCSNRDLNTTTHNEEILKMNTLLQALGMEIRL